ncbi:hypothetical protein [Clostridium haemolyticum]|uniref:Phage protein n=1 Tax=Clostridium haemolyticum NCTC 9693 TaxID=1443114 RepID=A0ABR4THB3_CLOHA|nr:hypothetical protein [Clostridium haemolyticum]KEI18250.1 hypothetical protein Z960_03785 [Clostridium haemolyticum NCTC 9693]KGN04172.1 hypothetical protein Z961_04275 [Clostridium haemolyticum NCTC 8350]
MVQSNFDIEIITNKEGKEEKKKVNVVVQEISPFRVTDILSSALNLENGAYKVGMLTEMLIDELVISPKNLKEQIEKAENATELITKVSTELRNFCDNPRCYHLKKVERECKEKVENMEFNTSKHNIDRS